MILIIKHIAVEGPGTIASFFQKKKTLKTIELSAGDPLPRDLKGVEAVIVMGGPMNVDEEDKYPFLRDENIFIQNVLKKEIPYLGICLGSQLLAKASGAKVAKSPVEEIGWFKVSLEKDPIFENLENNIDVFQWHGDTFDIPKSGKLLATATGCHHQALKVGTNAYGLQFHVEVTGRIIDSWIKAHFKGDTRKQKSEEMISTYLKLKSAFNRNAETVYQNFEKIIEQSKQ
ncbi:MAG: type 1 glutamine amidotransferase [Candidatus Omnitrophota bacterium]